MFEFIGFSPLGRFIFSREVPSTCARQGQYKLPSVSNTKAERADWTIETLSQKDPLAKGMATHSSTFAQRTMDRGAWRATVHRVAESPCNAGDTDSIPDRRTKILHATGQLSPSTVTRENPSTAVTSPCATVKTQRSQNKKFFKAN